MILTDIGLPGMSGIEGTRILRERFPEVPILALTVYDDDDNVFDAICAGASGYLLKTRAGAAARIAARGRGRRRADVTRRGTPRVTLFRRVPAAGPRLLPSDAAGDRAAQAAGRGAPLQDRRRRAGHLDQHRSPSI